MTQLRTAPEPTTRRPVPAPVLVALGLVAGVLAKAADESGWSWARDLGSFPAAWVLTVALLGRFAPSWRAAGIRAAGVFSPLSIAHYAPAGEGPHVGGEPPPLGAWGA